MGKSMLVIIQEVVPVKVFNNNLVGYRFEEFAEDIKEANGSIL